ncbi:MAG: ATP-binding cassette domain-containing protein [Deltaproteobacteria bacterium]|nr:ATP-binding cassette domain-containing protein [Deltaproteobacteria bacterium]NTV56654.1 ATP-binding cassette domain-containing protein [Deltaproteobacteria bacterium]
MNRQPIIQVKDLVARYGEETILEGVSFEVYEGEIFVILGGSGCGKSTLLKHLIGLIRPYRGQVIVDGEDITHADSQGYHRLLRKIGILYQGGALFGSMTLAENVALPIMEYTDLSSDLVSALVRMKLNLVQLEGYEDYLPSEISGGMKKRAGLARAMALNPKILFFDEPSAGLDPVTSAGLDRLILHLNKSLGTTMVIVTHELQSILTVAQRVIMLDKGTKGIVAEGDPVHLRETSRNPLVWRFFNRQPEESAHPA